MNRKTGNRTVLLILFAGFAVLLAVSTYHLYLIQNQTNQEQDAFSHLAKIVAAHTTEAPPVSEVQLPSLNNPSASASEAHESASTQQQILEQYLPLFEQNADFFAWLHIDDTQIDYPVMYTPWDSEFYLRRAFDGSSSRSGTPFLDGNCDPNGSYYLIYGHHISGGSMFGTLSNYAEPDYAKAHPIICLDTLYEKREYEVLAAFYSQVYNENEDVFCYYAYRNLSDPDDFAAFVKGVRALALYDTGVTAVYGDELLTLSTCNYHTDDGRFAVVAKRCR